MVEFCPGLPSPMRSEPMRSEAELVDQPVQLFLWFLASSEHDEAVRRALKLASERLVAESPMPLPTAPVHYQRIPAVESKAPARDRVTTWMDVHPPIAYSRSPGYLALVEQIALETGLTDWVRGERHAEWFSCA
jgi:hypothetical protein